MKKTLLTTLLLSSVFAITACDKEAEKVTNSTAEVTASEPQTTEVQPTETQPAPVEEAKPEATEEKDAPIVEEQVPAEEATPAETPKAKTSDEKLEEAKKAALDAANKFSEVAKDRLGDVTQSLQEKLNDIDVGKVTDAFDKFLKDAESQLDKLPKKDPLKTDDNVL